MSTEIARRDLGAEKDFAVALAGSNLLPKAYIGQPANVLVALEWAHALGVAPMVAMQQLYIIDGKPSASAQMIAGLVRRAGHNLRVQGDDTRAVCEITRSDDPDFVFKAVWTIERAKNAGLTGKGTWKQYPAAMLKARTITEAARDACPEALLGVASTDEMDVSPGPRKATAHLVPAPAPEPEPDAGADTAPPAAGPVEGEQLLPMSVVDESTGEIVDADVVEPG